MMALWAAMATASASPVLTVSIDQSVAVDTFSREAAATGRIGLAAVAVCRTIAPDLSVCLRRIEAGNRRVLVTLADLTDWGIEEDAAFASAIAHAGRVWRAAMPRPQVVEGMEGRYWLRSEADGFDCAGLLFPEELAALVGGEPVVACPDVAALMLWVPAQAAPGDFDKAVGVGVRRMAEASPHPGSPLLYRHSGNKWMVWAEVRGSLAPLDTPAAESGAPGPVR